MRNHPSGHWKCDMGVNSGNSSLGCLRSLPLFSDDDVNVALKLFCYLRFSSITALVELLRPPHVTILKYHMSVSSWDRVCWFSVSKRQFPHFSLIYMQPHRYPEGNFLVFWGAKHKWELHALKLCIYTNGERTCFQLFACFCVCILDKWKLSSWFS